MPTQKTSSLLRKPEPFVAQSNKSGQALGLRLFVEVLLSELRARPLTFFFFFFFELVEDVPWMEPMSGLL